MATEDQEPVAQANMASLSGSCKCGAVRYRCRPPMSFPANVFFCHCSMCPPSEAEPHGGIGWAGVPRPEYTGPLRQNETSSFCTRGTCAECEGSLFIRYTCEDHTDWVLHRTLDAPGNTCPQGKCWHIHCKGKIEVSSGMGFGDGLGVCEGWSCWEADPCRPHGSDTPAICFRCFAKVRSEGEGAAVCACPAGPLLQQPADGHECNVG